MSVNSNDNLPPEDEAKAARSARDVSRALDEGEEPKPLDPAEEEMNESDRAAIDVSHRDDLEPDEESAFAEEEPVERVPTESETDLPWEPAPQADLSDREADLAFREVRRFHVSGEVPPDKRIDADLLPVLLHPFRNEERVRTEYPLALFPPGLDPEERLCLSIGDYLESLVEARAPDREEARILKDNLPRLERHLRAVLRGATRPLPLREVLRGLEQRVVEELSLEGKHREHFTGDFQRLLEDIPDSVRVLGFGEHAPCHLLLLAIDHQLRPRWESFFREIDDLVQKLEALLEVERGKTEEARSVPSLARSSGSFTARHLNLDALSEVMGPHRGTEPMYWKRRERIERTLETLKSFLQRPRSPALVLLHDGNLPKDWLAGEQSCLIRRRTAPCLAAADLFDKQAAEMSEVYRARRIARLEIDGEFDPSLHKALLSRFTWESFNDEELRLLPPVVAFESPDSLAGQGLVSLSRLLMSGRPVQVVVKTISTGSPGVGATEDPLTGFRLEIGFLGISHRVAFVEQSSAARPHHLVGSFSSGLRSTRTSLHVMSSGLCRRGIMPRLGSWLHSGAALESRAHPFFRYDPEAGESWAECFDSWGNPQRQLDWPVYEFEYQTPSGERSTRKSSFTFADFALLEPAFRGHFMALPDGCPEEDLISMKRWVRLPWEEGAHKVPVVWAVGDDLRLVRLAVSRPLALAARDRVRFWRTLQELGGVNNLYARRAARRARIAALDEARQERERLEREHREELDRIRREEAGEAMQRLAQALVSHDWGRMAVGAPTAPRPAEPPTRPAPSEEPDAPAATEPEPSEEDEFTFDEPYIDTILCTSCNDCVNLNPRLFVYNANKQATIGDPEAGTFQDLVVAAEKCPARCIHPGKPRDPSEPGLDALMERARPFN